MALVVSIRRNTYVYIHTFIIARLERKRQTANESERGRTQYAGRGLRVYRAIVSVERLVFNKTNYCDQDRGWRVGSTRIGTFSSYCLTKRQKQTLSEMTWHKIQQEVQDADRLGIVMVSYRISLQFLFPILVPQQLSFVCECVCVCQSVRVSEPETKVLLLTRNN